MPIKMMAVAIGNGGAAVNHITDPKNLGAVRQYITGLVPELTNLGHTLGPTDYYVIDYRERTGDQLTTNPSEAFNGDLIFAMSTTVVRAAQKYTTTIPIVGIVSDPGPPPGEDFEKSANICGVSGQRHQTAKKCFDNFVNTVINPNFTNAVVLHKPDYNPSIQALALVKKEAKHKNIPLTVVEYTDPTQTVANWLSTLPLDVLPKQPTNTGVLILPVDLFFAAAGGTGGIIDLAQNTGLGTAQQKLPTFFFAPDWVQQDPTLSALGAYGVPQFTCGQLMAERVDRVWKYGVPTNPNNRWITAKNSDFQWVTNALVAQNFQYTPNMNGPDKNGPDKVYT